MTQANCLFYHHITTMVIKQKSTGYYLTVRGGFRKGMTCHECVASFHDPKVAGLASTIPAVFLRLCQKLRLDPEKIELSHDHVF